MGEDIKIGDGSSHEGEEFELHAGDCFRMPGEQRIYRGAKLPDRAYNPKFRVSREPASGVEDYAVMLIECENPPVLNFDRSVWITPEEVASKPIGLWMSKDFIMQKREMIEFVE